MFQMSGDANEAKDFIADLLDKVGIDEDKWREHMNSLPKEQRTMTFTFDTGDVKNGFIAKFNYIFTAVDLIITDQKVLDEFTKED